MSEHGRNVCAAVLALVMILDSMGSLWLQLF